MIQTKEATTFEKYPDYKDSGVEWIGEIPTEWNILPAKRFHQVIKELNLKRQCNNILSLTLRGVVNNNPDSPEGLVPKDYATYQIFQKNDLVFKLIDLENISTSRVGLVHEKGIMSSAYIRLVIGDNCLSKFAYYFYFSLYKNEVYNKLGSGVRSTLGPNDLLNLSFLKPSFEEQIAIAHFLDNKTSKIDTAIAQKEQMIALLKERKQIIIQNAVTKGLDPNVKMKDSGVEWIGEIPEGWKVVSVKHTLEIPITDGPHTTPQLLENGYPFISAEAIKDGKIDFSKKRGFISKKDHKIFCQKYKPKRGDIYMVKSGATTGNIAMVETDMEFSIWSPLAVFRTKEKVLSRFFLYNFLESYSFRKGVELKWSFGTQQNIGMGVLSDLPITFGNIKEQGQIVNYIKVQSTKIDRAITLQQSQIEKLKEYKAILIDGAVTGKIRVTDE